LSLKPIIIEIGDRLRGRGKERLGRRKIPQGGLSVRIELEPAVDAERLAQAAQN